MSRALKLFSFVISIAICSSFAQSPSKQVQRQGGKIAGRVIDNKGNAVTNVRISTQGKIVGESGKDGSFSVAMAPVDSRTVLTFAKADYVSNTKIYESETARDGNTVIIWPVSYKLKFDPSRELDVELGGSHIRIHANTLVGANQQKASGVAEIRFTLFDVTDRSEQIAASGDYSAEMQGGIRRLTSYGIFNLDVSDGKGQPLNLSTGSRADIAIPVPPKLARRAPKEVGFFDFDDRNGRWIPTGSFELDPKNLKYNGYVIRFNVPHNLDDPQDTTCVTVQVIADDGTPMPNFFVTAQAFGYASSGWTDNAGFVCLLVERNSTFTVTATGTTGSLSWGTPHPPTLSSPNFSSGASDCGNCQTCPFAGTVQVSFIVGTTHAQQSAN